MMTKKEINQVFQERLEVKDLEIEQVFSFQVKDKEHTVEVVGFLDTGDCICKDGLVHDVVVLEKHEHHSLLQLLSSYDSDFYEFEQEYIDVDFYK